MKRWITIIKMGLTTPKAPIMNAMAVIARPLNTSVRALNQLEELSKNYEIKEKAETFVLPKGISEIYFIRSNELKKLDSFPFNSLLELFRISETEQEFQQSKEIFTSWSKHNMISNPNRALMIDLLIEKNKALLFEFLANRFKYSLFPSHDHLYKLMQVYSLEFLAAKSHDSLDMMYKTFALLLYYDIPPTLQDYHCLISTGFYSSDEEGARRSLLCLKELQSLGWSLLPKTTVSLGYYHLQKKEYDPCLYALRAIDSKEALGLRIEAFIHKKELQEAKELFNAIVSAKEDKDLLAMGYLKSTTDLRHLVE
jgi:hypothetical protein